MKRLLSILVICCISTMLSAQVVKERRVYYLDCSGSMKNNGIWDEVRSNLKEAIDNVSDETTELVVVPFAFNMDPRPTLEPMQEFATPAGKTKLKSQIDALETHSRSMTYYYPPLADFYINRVDDSEMTYMFFMTDGQDSDSNQTNSLLPQWGKKFGDKQVYGFFVMLHGKPAEALADTISNQRHLWLVQTADVNMNLIRLQNQVTFDNDGARYVDLRIEDGDVSQNTFTAELPSSCPLKVTKAEVQNNVLRVWIDRVSGQILPDSSSYTLNIQMNSGGDYDILLTEDVSLICYSKQGSKPEEKTSPLSTIILWSLLGLLALLLLWPTLVRRMVYDYFKVGSMRITEPYYSQRRIKGARQVVFTNKTVKQGWISQFFKGKIIYETNSVWTAPVVFEATSSGEVKMQSNDKYSINPYDYKLKKQEEYTLLNEDTKDKIKLTIY